MNPRTRPVLAGLGVVAACSGSPSHDKGTLADSGGADSAEPEVDCSIEPELPFAFEELEDFGGAEDFDFDEEGHHGSVEDGNLILRDLDGGLEVSVPGLGRETAGTRLLPSGDWVVAVVGNGTLVKVTPGGGTEVLLTGLEYPNGVEVDPDGYVYVSENNGEQVRRVHSETGESSIIATGLVGPNGIVETGDGQTLYVGTCPVEDWGSKARIYRIDRQSPDTWAEPEIIFETERLGCIDAITVDACGRLYFADYGVGWQESTIWSLDFDTSEQILAAEVTGQWVPNMRWGHDRGGWSSTTLYASDRLKQVLYAIETELPGRKHQLDR